MASIHDELEQLLEHFKSKGSKERATILIKAYLKCDKNDEKLKENFFQWFCSEHDMEDKNAAMFELFEEMMDAADDFVYETEEKEKKLVYK